MDNAAKALEMAAGVLLGVLLFAAVAYFFNSISEGPERSEKNLSTEQLAEFNLEYEIYNKKRMYGVEVISCLNKALSNNEKYVEGNGFLTGTKYGNKYLIDVHIEINTPLEEHLRIYKILNGRSVEILDRTETPGFGKYNPKMSELHFKFPAGGAYTNLNPDKDIFENFRNNANQYQLTDEGYLLDGREYSLLDATDGPILLQLLDFSDDNMRQVKYNTTGKDLDVWNSVEWETALYYFKKKKFQCDDMGYSTDTGRVNLIKFSEYSN